MKRIRAVVLIPMLVCLFALGLLGSAAHSVRAGRVEQAGQDVSLGTPRGIISATYRGGFPAYLLAKKLTKESLPEFFGFLEVDSLSGPELMKSVAMIYQLNGKNDDAAIDKLLAFVKRPVDWARWRNDKQPSFEIAAAKWQALDTIGFIGGEKAEKILKNAITVEGANDLAKAWLPGVNPDVFKHESVLDNLRGMAANGLAYSKKPEIRQLIEAEYEKEKLRITKSAEPSSYYSNQLVDAMAKLEVVKEIGLERHAALYDGGDSLRDAYRKYISKYRIREASIPVVEIPRP